MFNYQTYISNVNSKSATSTHLEEPLIYEYLSNDFC